MRTSIHVKLFAAAAALALGVAVAVPVQATEYDDQRARAEEQQPVFSPPQRGVCLQVGGETGGHSVCGAAGAGSQLILTP